jgi:hypothetical protein
MDQQGRSRWRKGLLPILILVAVLLLLLVVPPLVSISRYKSQITRLISESLGRPVRLSSVELRMFPWPGFEINNLSVAEDPAFGSEPVLHANTVRASIRLQSLWRGRLEVGTISVDEASLNVVHSGPGKWNLDPLFRTAVAKAGSGPGASGSRHAIPLPYLEATNSRINFKKGAEKLPFSLVNAEFELWQESPGDWRVRLRGQPARTDVSLYQEDTGVVRLEASMQHASTLKQMPVRLDLDWRDAQLGQLSRLVFGSDPGWRGGLTGNLHLDGNIDSAHVTTRLQAEGVHRAEFAPVDALDFDARCDLVYHYVSRSFEKLACNSPLGDGSIHITGDGPVAGTAPQLTAELNHVPVAAGLGLLRTVRSGLAPDLQAAGTVSGKIVYDATAPVPAPAPKTPRSKRARPVEVAAGPLTGSLTVEGLTLSGGGLAHAIQAPKIVLSPTLLESPDPQSSPQRLAIAGSAVVPLGGPAPMTVDLNLTTAGYIAGLRGQVSMARARELTRAAGLAQAAALDGLAGDAIQVDLTAAGPWLAAEVIPTGTRMAGADAPAAAPAAKADKSPVAKPAVPDAKVDTTPVSTPSTDTLYGTLTLRNANWRADYLAGNVQITQATLNLSQGEVRWDPIDFSYGPLKGTASLELKTSCAPGETCRPQFTVALGALDAADLQTAILGVQQKGTMLSSLIDRLHTSSAPRWPALDGSIKADSLVLGAVTLNAPTARVRIVPAGAQITSITAGLLGGRLEASGSFTRAASDTDKPGYSFDGKLENLNAAAVGEMLGQRWRGGPISASGNVDLEGYTDKDLAVSAKGSLHFDWERGIVTAIAATSDSGTALTPVSLNRFDRWSGNAAIGSGTVTLGENQVRLRLHTDSIAGSVKFGFPPVVSLSEPKQKAADKPTH